MRRPPHLFVADVRVAAAWYARVFDGVIDAVDDERARLSRPPLELERGTPQPHPTTPVLELWVDDLPRWLAIALADGATRVTPATLHGYAHIVDRDGYLWALRERSTIPPNSAS